MSSRGVAEWARVNRAGLLLWAVAAVIMTMVVIGYSIGTDLALRDNRADAIAAGVR